VLVFFGVILDGIVDLLLMAVLLYEDWFSWYLEWSGYGISNGGDWRGNKYGLYKNWQEHANINHGSTYCFNGWMSVGALHWRVGSLNTDYHSVGTDDSIGDYRISEQWEVSRRVGLFRVSYGTNLFSRYFGSVRSTWIIMLIDQELIDCLLYLGLGVVIQIHLHQPLVYSVKQFNTMGEFGVM